MFFVCHNRCARSHALAEVSGTPDGLTLCEQWLAAFVSLAPMTVDTGWVKGAVFLVSISTGRGASPGTAELCVAPPGSDPRMTNSEYTLSGTR